MLVKDDVLAKLRRYFSLNLYEAKVWIALLSRGVSTAGELSDISNVPRSRSYDVLESLEKKGFVVMKIGKPIKYIAVPPHEVLERVKKTVVSSAETSVKRLDELKGTDMIDELNLLHSQGVELVEPTDLSGSLRGRINLYNHMEFTIRSAEESVIIMTTTQGLIRKIEGLLPLFEDLVKRGVSIKIAAPLVTDEAKKVASDLVGIAEVRHIDHISARFIIVDNSEMLFMVLNDDDVHPSYDLGIWVNTPFFSMALAQLFEIAWATLKPIKVKQ
jgi:HTH-type transcriptional regulator, sugar sensing transcriptional regulator